MENYKAFFEDFSKEVSREFAMGLVFKTKKKPDKSFKFTCHLGYEFEILIENIEILDYPIMIDELCIHHIDKRVPSFLTGIKYDMHLIHNGWAVSKKNIFCRVAGSVTSDLNSDLNNNFEALFGRLYFDDNFTRKLDKKRNEEEIRQFEKAFHLEPGTIRRSYNAK